MGLPSRLAGSFARLARPLRIWRLALQLLAGLWWDAQRWTYPAGGPTQRFGRTRAVSGADAIFFAGTVSEPRCSSTARLLDGELLGGSLGLAASTFDFAGIAAMPHGSGKCWRTNRV